MWVLFAPDAGTGPLWQTLEENEFFELQAYKPATASKNETSLLSMLTALPSSLLATSRTGSPSLIGGGTEESFPYRILLKTQPPYGTHCHASPLPLRPLPKERHLAYQSFFIFHFSICFSN
jgi:hypothetical protein